MDGQFGESLTQHLDQFLKGGKTRLCRYFSRTSSVALFDGIDAQRL
jgi:hypothetical protein